MRTRTFAYPCALLQGGAAVDGTAYPVAFTKEEALGLFWRVKRWTAEITMGLLCEGRLVQMAHSFVMEDVVGVNELDRIPDVPALSGNELLGASGMAFAGGNPAGTAGGRLNLFSGVAGPRGRITAAGIIPRLEASFAFSSDDGVYNVSLNTASDMADFPQGLVVLRGRKGGAFRILGRSVACYVLVEALGLPVTAFVSLLVAVRPFEWFAYADAGGTAVYNIATGAEVADPLTALVP